MREHNVKRILAPAAATGNQPGDSFRFTASILTWTAKSILPEFIQRLWPLRRYFGMKRRDWIGRFIDWGFWLVRRTRGVGRRRGKSSLMWVVLGVKNGMLRRIGVRWQGGWWIVSRGSKIDGYGSGLLLVGRGRVLRSVVI
jgi:hypothetical protein